MAGLYVHIPFCRKQCSYCDFHKSIFLENKKIMMASLLKEMEYRIDYLESESIETIYIGGGTPSVLSIDEINLLFSKIFFLFEIADDTEITFEANPDDLDNAYLEGLYQSTPVNRLSIGVQSFVNRDLTFLNRRHDSEKAKNAIRNALKAGFSNLSVDLIYAIPGMPLNDWIDNLNTVFSLNIHHLSAYHLTFEPGTQIYSKLKNNEIVRVTEDESLQQYKKLTEISEMAGYDHYEISNFSLPGYVSRHNSNYWRGKKYLGIGPSAHSYNLKSRQWNTRDNVEYIRKIKENTICFKMEKLNRKTKYNERIMTGLRTKWGIDLKEIERHFGAEYYESLLSNARTFIENGDMYEGAGHYILTRKGMLIADYIISALFLDE
jgi:oxygen-independent coproporphyrinogen-3 oxidase